MMQWDTVGLSSVVGPYGPSPQQHSHGFQDESYFLSWVYLHSMIPEGAVGETGYNDVLCKYLLYIQYLIVYSEEQRN